jgi:DNA-binding GntR family transcriptional regulator
MDTFGSVDPGETSNSVRGAPRRRVRSMSDQVTETLREMILVGEFLPSQQVTHDQIAETLQVSTMPVREALLRLTHEGLIEGGAKARSFRISVTTRKDIEDIYWMHSRLAGELTARAATLLSDANLAELQEAHNGWLEAAKTGDSAGLESTNYLFHKIINLGADSPKLLRFMMNTHRFIPHQFYSILPDQVAALTAAHVLILNAIVARDPETARSVAEDHVRARGVELIKNFDDRGFWVVRSAPEQTVSTS